MPEAEVMWHHHLGVISIGCQCGGPSDNGIGIIKIDLWRLLKDHCVTKPCSNVEHFGLALRVGGEFTDYTPERIHRVRRTRKDRMIGCDIDIPVAIWKPRTTNELKDYLATQVQSAVSLLIARLQKDNEPVEEEALMTELNVAVNLFRKNQYENQA